MSMPADQQQLQPPPPPATTTQVAYNTRSTHGSIGPVIGVLAIVIVFGILAGLVGRLCYGRRRIMGRGGYYDIEGWLERKCSSCIDGRINIAPPPPPPSAANVTSGDSAPASVAMQAVQEPKQEDHSPPSNPPADSDS
ncbi:uncharacterized protein LOC131162803 [Malania oleifera]|uniref:uncharacterized protein LOC131162803 n=1 Tax=Malania oleifera TaxID=397392 RepID=UPI0025ADD212|nr:uncharacterized protein LOC131162803 [Malania oleifera]